MNLSGVSRKKAFLGNITTAVRDKTWKLCQDQETILDVCCGNGLFFLNATTQYSGNHSLLKSYGENIIPPIPPLRKGGMEGGYAKNTSIVSPSQKKKEWANKRLLVGIDMSESLLKEAQKIFQDNSIEGVNLICGNAFQLPFKPETFDRVVCVNTLLNLSSLDMIETLLVELMRTCKVNGKLLVDIRNRANPYIRLKYWIHARKQKFPVTAYKAEDITNVFNRHEFHCTRILPIGWPLEFIAKAFLIEAEKVKHQL